MKKSLYGLIAILLIATLFLAACSSTEGNTKDESGEAAKPSNAGGPGEAVNLKGDAAQGQQIFANNCVACHGEQGKGGIANPGSKDGTVPPLNPIDSTMVSSDYKTFATNIDLFVQHGSVPEPTQAGVTPALQMKAFGDQNLLTQQQIADVIAYVISLNQK